MLSPLVLIVLVVGSLVAATSRPNQVAHALAGLFGVAALLAGFGSFTGSLPITLSLVLVGIGVLTLFLTYHSAHRSRAAWAFLAALLAVMAVCTLFGAPKIRTLLGVNMWIALLAPGLLSVACTAFGMIADEYRETLSPRRQPT
jgi:hypothetical protein